MVSALGDGLCSKPLTCRLCVFFSACVVGEKKFSMCWEICSQTALWGSSGLMPPSVYNYFTHSWMLTYLVNPCAFLLYQWLKPDENWRKSGQYLGKTIDYNCIANAVIIWTTTEPKLNLYRVKTWLNWIRKLDYN